MMSSVREILSPQKTVNSTILELSYAIWVPGILWVTFLSIKESKIFLDRPEWVFLYCRSSDILPHYCHWKTPLPGFLYQEVPATLRSKQRSLPATSASLTGLLGLLAVFLYPGCRIHFYMKGECQEWRHKGCRKSKLSGKQSIWST